MLDDIDDPEEFTRRFNQAAGPCLEALCHDRDFTQEDIGTLLGISSRQVRRIYRGKVAFTLPQILLMARKTKTTLDEILDLISHWPAATIPRKTPRKRRAKR